MWPLRNMGQVGLFVSVVNNLVLYSYVLNNTMRERQIFRTKVMSSKALISIRLLKKGTFLVFIHVFIHVSGIEKSE